MAITIVNTPATYSSMHDDLWFVASSTNAGTTNFKFVYDVKVNGTTVARTKVFPNPSGTYGIFNASPIVRNYVTNYFEPSGNSILVSSNDKLKVDYTIEIREDLNGSIGVNADASGTFSAYNFYPPLFADILAVNNNTPLVISNYYNNLLITNFSDDWLTERNINNIIYEYGDNFFISYFRKTTGGTWAAVIDIIGQGETLITSYNQFITLNGEFNLFNLSAASINTWVSGSPITSSTYGFDFYLTRNGIATRKVKVRLGCYPKYKQYNLHFINRLGGWDSMKFALQNKRTTDFQRQSYRRNDWQLSGSSMKNVDAYNRYNETAINYSVGHKDKYHLVSDWVTEQDYDWLSQLVGSTNVYMEVLGMYFPVLITQDNYQFKYINSDKLFNFEIDIEVSKYRNSQFR